ncbi:MAG: histidinol-phosphate transaminase [Sulfuriflexus sp.]|nr:histidinol-phosphate transaminase [Sulfuriflexus sp.]
MDDKIQNLVREEVRALSAYHVPNPGDAIKLDAMENPYQFPPELVEQWLSVLKTADLNRYPDPSARELKQVIRTAMHIPENMELLLGNGSDEIIQIIIMALAKSGAVVMAPEPTFVMYKMITTFCNVGYAGVPLENDFSLDMPAMRAAMQEQKPAVIFLAWPNNPTGNLFAEADVIEIIENAPGLVVVDEAYTSFAEVSFMDKLADYDNLVVMRTVSKSGLAGLRLGYLAGSAAWLDEFDKVRMPYNINVLTQLSAKFALENVTVLDEQAAKLRAARSELMQALNDIKGIEAFESAANFILFRIANASDVFACLKDKNILIKNLDPAGGALANCLRVTVSTPEENSAFLSALKSCIA